MANDIKWIKITTDIFDDGKMISIESLPDGYLLEVVWFKILCFAGKCNQNGFLCMSDKMVYTDEILAKVFRMDVGVVKRALEVFQKLEMIEIVDNAYMVSNWLIHQSGDRLEDMKASNRERQQRYRDKQKELRLEEKRNVTNNVTDDVINNVNHSYSYSNNNINNNISNTEKIKDIIDYLNQKLGKHYTYSNKSYNSNINARLKEGFEVDDFKKVIDIKYEEWKNTEFSKYLTPDTLFAPSKFEKYLNQKQEDLRNGNTEQYGEDATEIYARLKREKERNQ